MTRSEIQIEKSSPAKYVVKDDTQKTEDAKERQRQYGREYYWKNREKILAQQREYYARQDKAVHAARTRKYRSEHKEQMSAKRKEYRRNNVEKFKEYEKKYRQKNKENISASSKAYWAANRERLLTHKREYNAKTQENRRQYYENNRYRICNHSINIYCLKAIDQIREMCIDRVNNYMNRFPFEEYAEPHIKRTLNRYNIYKFQGRYADCYDAGILAYLYSIHRCAAMQYAYTEAYIKSLTQRKSPNDTIMKQSKKPARLFPEANWNTGLRAIIPDNVFNLRK